MKLMGKALFFLSGDLHHSVRKLLNPAFGIKILESKYTVDKKKLILGIHKINTVWLIWLVAADR